MQAGTKIATLGQLLVTRVKLTWPYRINLQVNSTAELDKMRNWCENHAKGNWRVSTEFIDYFQFQDDADAVMFMLKFGGSRGVS